MLRMPDAEEERGGIAVGSEKRGGADRLEARGRRRSGGGGWMDPIERRRKARLRESGGGCGDCARVGGVRFTALFLFFYFLFSFFTKIYFQYYNLQFCTPTALLGGGRGPAAPQEGGRVLFVNKKKFICADALGGSLPPPCRAAGPLPPLHWAAGSPLLYKRFPLPPHLLPTTSREREGERRGEGGSCNGEALPDFGS